MTGRVAAFPLHLTAATLLRVSAEGLATALVLTVQARTGDAATAGFLQTAMTLPYVLSGPVIGHMLDRAARPRPLVAAVAVGYAVATALLLLTAGRSPMVTVLIIAAVIGCTEPIVVALTGLLPRFVPAERLSRAYGLEASSYSVAAIAGPGLAAGLAAMATGPYAGIAIVGAAVLGALVLPLVPYARRPAEVEQPRTAVGVVEGETRMTVTVLKSGGGGDSAAERPAAEPRIWLDVVIGGLSVLAHNRILLALTVATTFAWIGFGGVAVAAVLLAQHVGAEPSAGGQLLASFAVGALAGSLASSRWLTARHAEVVMLAGLVAFGAALAALALVPSLPWALAVFAVVGMFEGPVFAATLMLRQRESPPERLGQVNTTAGSLKIGVSALGAALTAAFADAIGAVGLVLAIGAFPCVGAALGLAILRFPRR